MGLPDTGVSDGPRLRSGIVPVQTPRLLVVGLTLFPAFDEIVRTGPRGMSS